MVVLLNIATEKILLTYACVNRTLVSKLGGLFFATSHGKQPFDGIGSTLERLVSKASL